MKAIKFKQVLEVVTNFVVLVAAIVLVAFLTRAYFTTPSKRAAAKLPASASIGEIKDLDYGDAHRILILVLSTQCKYCVQSAPFYRTLASMRGNLVQHTRILGVFPEDEASVKSFLAKSQVEIEFRSDVDLSNLNVLSTPTLILLDKSKNILDSWVGTLSTEQQAEVVKTISEANSESLVKKSDIEANLSVFDESSPSVAIMADSLGDDLQRVVNFFGVDRQGHVFLINGSRLMKYGSKGEFIVEARLPDQFHGAFCVDEAGNSYLPSKSNLVIYDSALKHRENIPLPRVLSPGSVVLKMAVDTASNALYMQIYESEPLNQILYKLDLTSRRVAAVFKLEKPVRFSPNLSVGAFDFALGSRHIYISDIYDYKVFSYSLSTGKYQRTFSRPFSPILISEQDGDLKLRKMRIGNLAGQAGYLKNYPPILHLNIAENGMIVVWTSRRNSQHKQVVDIYDENFKPVGTDLKYAHPTISNYVFMNGNVYAPDFGFGKNLAGKLSPLEVPALPLAVKVFRDNLSDYSE